MRIGVLAVQGAFIEHEKIINKLGADAVEIRQEKDLDNLDGLILPGGESTVQAKLLKKLNIHDKLKAMIKEGLPTLATCAGLILIAEKIDNDKDEQHLGTLPVAVTRNAFGRQLSSFITASDVGEIKDYEEIFIRAPYISSLSQDVEVLSTFENKVVGVKFQNQIGLAFHPELTSDTRIHEAFIGLIKKNTKHTIL